MIDFNIDEEHAILTVCPEGALSEQDFTRMAAAVDPVIEQKGDLAGLVIHAKSFSGWDSFASMLSHFRFVRDHHRHIKKLAVVSDSAVLTVFPQIAAHFISAELKHFHFNEYSDALTWIQAGEQHSRPLHRSRSNYFHKHLILLNLVTFMEGFYVCIVSAFD